MSDAPQSEAGSPPDQPDLVLEASRNPRLAAQGMLNSYRSSLQFRADAAQTRRDILAAALRRQQEAVQDMMEQAATMEGSTPAQRDALRQGLERRLAAARNFAEMAEALNAECFTVSQRRLIDFCDDVGRSMIGTEDGTTD